MIKIKGHEIEPPSIKASFGRKAVQFQNSIVQTLKAIGVPRDRVHIEIEALAQKKAPASASWYFNGRNLKYTYSLMLSYVENLYIIDRILKIEVERLLSKEISEDEFSREFSEGEDHSADLMEARKTLGVKIDEMDFEVISKAYKELARKYHPDMPTGNHEMFQKINAAHKLIKKELM
jgi:hypothetical protein